jgi:hypothetical protein
MRTRKRNRILKRLVLGFAVFALVVPSAAMAVPDAGRTYQPPKEQGGVQLADPKYGQSADKGTIQLADPKFGQQGEKTGSIELRDFPKSLPPVEVGTYGMPSAGLNVYLRTHNGKALVTPRDEVSTPTQVVASRGFDWRDAGIGAGILAGFLLMGAGAILATRQLGRPQTA